VGKPTSWPVGKVFEALELLSEVGVWNASITGHAKPNLHVSRETLLQVAEAAEVRPAVAGQNGEFWEVQVDTGAYVVKALFKPDELPQIGYKVVNTASVIIPIEPTTEEGAQHG
jgi:hypothetical protein